MLEMSMHDAGAVRESSGVDRAHLVKQPHGGALRRGGGAPARSADQVAAYRLLREGSLKAATTILKAAEDGNLKAAELVLFYALGRPQQRVELTGDTDFGRRFLDELEDDERRALRDAIRAEISSRDAAGA